MKVYCYFCIHSTEKMMLFKHPCSIIIAGPSQSGKTNLLIKILENVSKMVEPPPKYVIYFYEYWQPSFKNLKKNGVIFKQGLPDERKIPEDSVVVLDDKMQELDSLGTGIYTKTVHHKKISLITILQNIFPKQRCQRTMSLNANYIILTSNKRDRSQISCLAKQISPGKSQEIVEAYCDATATPYGYLVFDFHVQTDDRFRLRTEIFPGEKDFAYIRKEVSKKNQFKEKEMSRLKRNKDLILKLQKLTPGQRKNKRLNDDFINSCRDCAKNILDGRIKVKRHCTKNFKKITNRKTTTKNVKKIIHQGGFLSILLPILAGLIQK